MDEYQKHYAEYKKPYTKESYYIIPLCEVLEEAEFTCVSEEKASQNNGCFLDMEDGD